MAALEAGAGDTDGGDEMVGDGGGDEMGGDETDGTVVPQPSATRTTTPISVTTEGGRVLSRQRRSDMGRIVAWERPVAGLGGRARWPGCRAAALGGRVRWPSCQAAERPAVGRRGMSLS